MTPIMQSAILAVAQMPDHSRLCGTAETIERFAADAGQEAFRRAILSGATDEHASLAFDDGFYAVMRIVAPWCETLPENRGMK